MHDKYIPKYVRVDQRNANSDEIEEEKDWWTKYYDSIPVITTYETYD